MTLLLLGFAMFALMIADGREADTRSRDAARAALNDGDVDRLRALLAADPSLVHARTNLDPPYGYFSGATLLHHVAGNPYRDKPLPPNVVDIARVLLAAGADVHARTLGPTAATRWDYWSRASRRVTWA